jgi:dTDP-glucose 4,6-dehydratase
MLFKGRSGCAYNVGSEDALNVATLAREVAAAAPQPTTVNIGSASVPGALVHRYIPSTARARQELGLCVEVPLRDAIGRTRAWFASEAASAQSQKQQVLSARGAHA